MHTTRPRTCAFVSLSLFGSHPQSASEVQSLTYIKFVAMAIGSLHIQHGDSNVLRSQFLQ